MMIKKEDVGCVVAVMCLPLIILGLMLTCYKIGYDKGHADGEMPGGISAGVDVVVNFNAATENEEPEPVIMTKESLGRFKLTAYCPCEECCGKSNGITASGTKAEAGRTIAVDPSVIPYGTKVEINGKEYVAEDTGSGVGKKHIDIFMDSHEDAVAFGVQYAEVYILEELK